MITKRFLLGMSLIICLAGAASVVAQDSECGSVPPPEMYQYEQDLLDSGWDYSQLAEPDFAEASVPLTIHIVRTNSGTGGLSAAELTQTMTDLNTMYAPMNLCFFIKGLIDYIDDDNYYYNTASDAQIDALRGVNVVDSTINIYFVGSASGFPYCGLSSFTFSPVQGIVMKTTCSGTLSQSTVAHEIGHYFDLFHTHEQFYGIECPDGSNCLSTGDLLCDTPADPKLSVPGVSHVSAWPECVYDDYASTPVGCSGTYDPQTENIMSYSRKKCRDFWSDKQIAKALNTLNMMRTELLGGICFDPPLIFIWPPFYDIQLPKGGLTLANLIIGNNGGTPMDYFIAMVETPAVSTITDILIPELIEATTINELSAINIRDQKRSKSGFDDTSEDIFQDVAVVQPERVFPNAQDARSGALLPTAALVTSFPDYSGNLHPMSIAFDGTYYWVVGGGSSSGEVAQLNASFGLVMTRTVNLDCRSVFYNPADGEVYIKSFINNALYRLHTAPFDGGVDQIFLNQFQHGQSNVCLSPDGQFMYDHFNGMVVKYNFSTGAVVDSITLNLQHATTVPWGNNLAHTGSYLLTIGSGSVFAYDPVTGGFIDSSIIPTITTYDWSPAYANGMFFIANFAEDTWYAYMIDAGSGPEWLSANSLGGSVPPGGADTIEVTFDAATLSAGDYSADIRVSSNDPSSPMRIVPVTLLVDGTPIISVSPSSLSQTLLPGASANQTMWISNSGDANLNYIIYHSVLPKSLPVPDHPVTISNDPGLIGSRTPDAYDVAPSIGNESITYGKSSAVTIDVLLMHSISFGPHVDSLAADLITYPDIGLVTLYDCGAGTPTLAQMQSYDIILMTTDGWYTNMTLASENVALYLDGGGKVIISTFGWSTQGDNTIDGRLLSDYSPFQIGGATLYLTANLGTTLSGHPLFSGVTALSAYFRDNVTLSTGTALLGTWDDSHLMSAQKGNVLGLNFATHLSSSTHGLGWTGDGLTLIHNALIYMTEDSWLSYAPITGTVSPGGNQSVGVHFDANGLTVGDYYADMFVSSNDPVTPLVMVPVHLAVGGTACITVVPDSLEEMLSVGDTSHQGMTISNCGTGDLNYLITHNEILKTLTVPENPAVYAAKNMEISASGSQEQDVSFRGGDPMQTFGAPGSPGLSVFIMYANVLTEGPDSMAASLLAYPDIGSATILDCRSATPTLGQLSGYDLVIVGTDGIYADFPTACENVALYLDGGGKTVLVGFSWYGSPFGIVGRLLTDYSPFGVAGPSLYTVAGIGSTVPGHPLFDGVSSLSAYFRDNVGLSAGAALLGTWSDGHLMAAEKGNVVALNFAAQIPATVVPGFGWNGDGWIMLHNAVAYLTAPSWLSYTPSAGTIPPGGSQPVDVRFDATGLSIGDYNAMMNIASNAPASPNVAVPVHLLVAGDPVISVVPDSLDETLPGGGTSSQPMTVFNTGNGNLNVSITVAQTSPGPMVVSTILNRHEANLITARVTRPLSASDETDNSVGWRNGEDGPLPQISSEDLAGNKSSSWISRTLMITARGQHGFVAHPNGNIYAFGGYSLTSPVSTTVLEIYNTATNSWSLGAPLPGINRGMATAIDNSGFIYSFASLTPESYRYNPATNAWSMITNMPVGTAWEGAAATGLDGKIYLFGGELGLSALQIYDPATDSWSSGASLPTGRLQHSAVTGPAGLIYVMGGRNFSIDTAVNIVEIYNPATNTWSSGAPMPTGRSQFGIALGGDGRIYTIGGKQGYGNGAPPFHNEVEVYNPATNSWQIGPALPTAMGEIDATIYGGNIYVSGGVDSTGFRSATMMLSTLGWLTISPMVATIPPGGSQNLSANFDAAGLADGDYYADVMFSSNDPATPMYVVPAHLLVTGGGSCCLNRGDMDHSGGAVPVDISDLTLFSDYMFMGGRPPVCMDEADANSDGGPDISDLTFIIDFMFHGGAPPGPCF